MGGGNGVKNSIIYTHSIFIVDFHSTDYIAWWKLIFWPDTVWWEFGSKCLNLQNETSIIKFKS